MSLAAASPHSSVEPESESPLVLDSNADSWVPVAKVLIQQVQIGPGDLEC